MEERLTPESQTDGGGGSARRRSGRRSLAFGPIGIYVIDLLSGSAYFNARTCVPYDISDFVDRLPVQHIYCRQCISLTPFLIKVFSIQFNNNKLTISNEVWRTRGTLTHNDFKIRDVRAGNAEVILLITN